MFQISVITHHLSRVVNSWMLLFGYLLRFSCAFEHYGSSECRIVSVKSKTHKVKITAIYTTAFLVFEPEHLPIIFQCQSELFFKIFLDELSHLVEFSFVTPEDDHIIHITDVVDRSQPFFDVVVESFKIPVRQPL